MGNRHRLYITVLAFTQINLTPALQSHCDPLSRAFISLLVFPLSILDGGSEQPPSNLNYFGRSRTFLVS